MELDYKAIGKRIRIARIRSGITQEKLSETIDLSPTHMSNIETGTTKVSLTTIVNIANALAVTVDDLLCDNVIHARVPFEKDIQCFLETCDDYEIRIAKELLISIVSAIKCNKALKEQENEYRMK